MTRTRVYRVKSDVETTCHCGHRVLVNQILADGKEVKKESSYFLIKTDEPRWLSICEDCVHLLQQPVEVKMEDLVHAWSFERRMTDRPKPERKTVREVKQAEKDKEREEKAEWV